VLAAMPDNYNDLYFFAKTTKVLENKIAEENYNTISLNSILSETDTNQILNILSSLDTAGMIVFGDIPHHIAQLLTGLAIPVVYVGSYEFDLPLNAVIEDNVSAVSAVVQHLSENGYEKIGFIGDINQTKSFWERYFTLWGCLKKYQLNYYDEYIFNMEYSKIVNYEYMADFFSKLKSFPEAFVCVNDEVAAVAVKALYQIGKNVPGDIGIVGFDNTEIAHISIPTLTTIDTFPQNQSITAFNLLQRKIESGNRSVERIVVPVKMVVGGSTRNLKNDTKK
jgi:LacI family transcriptional regulator